MKHIIATLTVITLAACGAPSDEQPDTRDESTLLSSLPGYEEYLAMADELEGKPLPFDLGPIVVDDPDWTGQHVEKDGIDFMPLLHGAIPVGSETPDGDCKSNEAPCWVPKNRGWVIGRCLNSIGDTSNYPDSSYVAAVWNGIDLFKAYVNGFPGNDAWNVSIANTCNGQYTVRPTGYTIPGALGQTTYSPQDTSGSARRWAVFDTEISVPSIISQTISFNGGNATTVAQVNNMLMLVTLHELLHSAGLSHDNGRFLMHRGGTPTLMTYQTNVSGMVGYKAEQRIRKYRP
jgi:hypothetical protein